MANNDQQAGLRAQLSRLNAIPGVPQVLMALVLAASVAGGLMLFFWSRAPDHATLYAGLEPAAAGEVVQALRASGVAFRVNEGTGAILVPAERVLEVRMELAQQGLPQSPGMGAEYLRQDPGLSVSKGQEEKRHHHMLETELARTISSLRPVRQARVHLALPPRSVFIRERRDPSASVVLELYRGALLEGEQVAAIVHLVASSIPDLGADKVTVVDQQGRLLSATGRPEHLERAMHQLEYTRSIEARLVQRLQELLTPLVGIGRFQTQVAVDMDFTVSEQTEERYGPDSVVRSERQREERRRGDPGAGGVPGALSNTPPGAAAEAEAVDEDAEPRVEDLNVTRDSTVNREVDRTISHTRQPSGRIRRLSVAVLLDHKRGSDPAAAGAAEPWSDRELAEITRLSREAVGFDAGRGDTIEVVNAAFRSEPLDEPEPMPLWQQPWLLDLVRQGAGLALLLAVVLVVVRPTLRSLLATLPPAPPPLPAGAGGLAELPAPAGAAHAQLAGATSKGQALPALPAAADPEQQLAAARSIAEQDPKRVAKILKEWVSEHDA